MHKKFYAILAVLLFAGIAMAADVRTNKRMFNREQLQIHTGTAVINTGSATWTNWNSLVKITPDGQHALGRAKIVVDLGKATTGWASTATSQTITFTLARAVDGTNFRDATNLITTAISGTNSTGLSIELDIGSVGPTEQVRLDAKISSATGLANTDFPYVLYYEAGSPATLTLAN